MTEVKRHRSLRDAFGQFATGVTVVTTLDKNGGPVGLTVNSFASVSLDPPLVSWCVDKNAMRYSDFAEAKYYSISVLSAEQQALSNLFATRSNDDTVFNDIKWSKGHHDVPQLSEVSARFHCETAHLYEGGDHLIIVGSVLDYECDPKDPLVFSQGDYRTLAET